MKNLILILFLGLSLSLVTPSKVHSQTITPTGETYISQTQATPDQAQPQQNFFQKILGKVKNGLTYGVLTLLIGVLIPSPWKTIIKTITGRATVILKEVGDLSLAGSHLSQSLNNLLNDDNSIKENSWPEVLAAGKEVKAELNDVIISIKPKA